MKATVWYKEGMFEINEALLDEMEDKVLEMSGQYCNYVLSAYWDEDHLHFYADGPWEC